MSDYFLRTNFNYFLRELKYVKTPHNSNKLPSMGSGKFGYDMFRELLACKSEEKAIEKLLKYRKLCQEKHVSKITERANVGNHLDKEQIIIYRKYRFDGDRRNSKYKIPFDTINFALEIGITCTYDKLECKGLIKDVNGKGLIVLNQEESPENQNYVIALLLANYFTEKFYEKDKYCFVITDLKIQKDLIYRFAREIVAPYTFLKKEYEKLKKMKMSQEKTIQGLSAMLNIPKFLVIDIISELESELTKKRKGANS